MSSTRAYPVAGRAAVAGGGLVAGCGLATLATTGEPAGLVAGGRKIIDPFAVSARHGLSVGCDGFDPYLLG